MLLFLILVMYVCFFLFFVVIIYLYFQNFKLLDEMEEEEKEVQFVKFQEFICCGILEDLQEVNCFMKVMVGYDICLKIDYCVKVVEEIGKIQVKVCFFEECFEVFCFGDEVMKDGDVFSEFVVVLQSVYFKIQKMCEEELDDYEVVVKLFEINDSINRMVQRYKLLKKGDFEGVVKVVVGGFVLLQIVIVSVFGNELLFIDFDVDVVELSVNGGSNGVGFLQSSGFENDFFGFDLSGGDLYGQGGNIFLGFGVN